MDSEQAVLSDEAGRATTWPKWGLTAIVMLGCAGLAIRRCLKR